MGARIDGSSLGQVKRKSKKREEKSKTDRQWFQLISFLVPFRFFRQSS